MKHGDKEMEKRSKIKYLIESQERMEDKQYLMRSRLKMSRKDGRKKINKSLFFFIVEDQ